MAVLATYYLNGPTLGSSTTIFSNSSLSTVAPNGFYSDGVTSREQVSGVLLPPVTCDSCTPSVTYNCVSGECIDPGDGTGTYSTLIDCENNCEPIACIEYLVTNTNDPSGPADTIIVTYTDCFGVPQEVEIAAGAGQYFCAEEASYVLPPAGALSIVGPCLL